MYKKILVPIDGSKASELGIAEALQLARLSKARVKLVYVVNIFVPAPLMAGGAYSETVPRALHSAGAKLLKAAEARARRHRVHVESELVDTVGGRVADVILELGRKWKADLIVMGTHGRTGLTRLALGSDAERVVRSARIPVLVVHPRARSRR